MFQISLSEHNGLKTFALSGRIEEEELGELQKLLKTEVGAKAIVLDLTNVKLLHREAVKFLATCETGGIELRNCPSYVREWIEKGKG